MVVVGPSGDRARIRPFPPAPLTPVHLRARLLRAARQLRVRRERQRGADEPRPAAGPRAAGRRRRRRAGSGLGRLRGDRLRGGVRHPAADGPDPQPLRRPDLHRAAAVDPPLRREGEAEPGAQHPRKAGASSWWTTRSSAARPAGRSSRWSRRPARRKCTCASAARRPSRRASTASTRRADRS